MNVTVILDVEVYDAREAYVAARNKAFADMGGYSPGSDPRATMKDVHAHLRDGDGAVHLPSCVQWMLDPGESPAGTRILNSSAE